MSNPFVQLPMFQTLPAAERSRLAAASEVRAYRKGQTVFEENHTADAVWLITHGWVYLVKRGPHGEPATIFAMTPNETLCGLSAFERGTYSAGAVAATDSELLRIPADHFAHLLDRHPAFTKAVLLVCCGRIRQMAETMSLAGASVEQRLAHTLLRLQATFGETIPITHQELARMAGTRWETSIRTLSAMRRRGWLMSARGRVMIREADQLRAVVRHARTERNGHAV